MNQTPRSEQELTTELTRMARSQFTYTEVSYARLLAELAESILRRVQRENREEIQRHMAEDWSYNDEDTSYDTALRAEKRLRLYIDLSPHYALGEILYNEGFKDEKDWPRTAYHPNQDDLRQVLELLGDYRSDIEHLEREAKQAAYPQHVETQALEALADAQQRIRDLEAERQELRRWAADPTLYWVERMFKKFGWKTRNEGDA